MRLIFAGTPDFAARALEALHAAGHEIPLVLTQPDRPAGRGMKLQASAVKTAALARGLAVFQPERLKDPATHAPLREVDADIMVVAAYGLILPQAVLDIPRLGCINIHASLLPRWRGAAPIHRAIEAGDAATGITLMQMDAGLDTGAMLLRQACPILAADTSGSLHDRLAALGAHCIVDLLGNIAQGKSPPPVPQPSDGVTYASKIDKAEARLEWSQPAASLARKVRAFNPFPGASATIGEETLKIWQAAEVDVPVDDSLPPGAVVRGANKRLVVRCGEGALELLEVQSPGGKRTTAREWLGRQASAA